VSGPPRPVQQPERWGVPQRVAQRALPGWLGLQAAQARLHPPRQALRPPLLPAWAGQGPQCPLGLAQAH